MFLSCEQILLHFSKFSVDPRRNLNFVFYVSTSETLVFGDKEMFFFYVYCGLLTQKS